MNILMMTNTFTPHVGGVARSVEAYTHSYIQQGHNVLVVAPEFPNMPEDEHGVVRIPAIQKFNGSDFSVVIPLSRFLGQEMRAFEPDIVHSHHPFLIGSTAVRVANTFKIPLVFTHHTMYEQYTHYVPGNSQMMKAFAINLATAYANMCDAVFAPSQSIVDILVARGVKSPIHVVPTGVNLETFSRGSGQGFKQVMGIPEDVFVLGHLGRLAAEKNLQYLINALILVLQKEHKTHFLLVGSGPIKSQILTWFKDAGVTNQVHHLGFLEQPLLASAYQAIDLFVFASKSETQGMVITEAMAASVPVIALDAPGIREVVVDNYNGRLLAENDDYKAYADALLLFINQLKIDPSSFKEAARATARGLSIQVCAENALAIYADLLGKSFVHRTKEHQLWSDILPNIESEYEIIKNYLVSATDALSDS